VLFIDELQYVEELQMAALISALHRCSQEQLPVTVVGAGFLIAWPDGRGQILRGTAIRFSRDRAARSPDAREAIVRPLRMKGPKSWRRQSS